MANFGGGKNTSSTLDFMNRSMETNDDLLNQSCAGKNSKFMLRNIQCMENTLYYEYESVGGDFISRSCPTDPQQIIDMKSFFMVRQLNLSPRDIMGLAKK